MFQFLQAEAPAQLMLPDSVQKQNFTQAVNKLTDLDLRELLTSLLSEACWVVLKIVLALVAYFVCRWIIRKLIRVMNAALERHSIDVSLRSFLDSLVSVVLYIIVGLFIIQMLGFNTTSFVAIFASASLAVGMALSGTLQNFAGGVMILILRPYRIGDYISAQGQSGTVEAIRLFTTTIKTPDNQTIYVPNSSISTAIIDNYSTAPTRRVDITVGISYGDDFDVAKAALLKIIAADTRILRTPAPVVLLKELADSSVNLSVRVWTKGVDYWDVNFALNEQIYKELPKVGISFPFPQLDVHIANNQ